jgi:hypothetical protein
MEKEFENNLALVYSDIETSKVPEIYGDLKYV